MPITPRSSNNNSIIINLTTTIRALCGCYQAPRCLLPNTSIHCSTQRTPSHFVFGSRELHAAPITMGKKKAKGDYNDFLDGEKLRDNAAVRTSLNPTSTTPSLQKPISPPPNRDNAQLDAQHRDLAASTSGTAPGSGPRKTPAKPKSSAGKGKGNAGVPKKPPLTHFLCLPLVNASSRPTLDAGLAKLKAELRRSGIVPEKAVRPVGTLHLTLGVMSLDDAALERVGLYLRSLDVGSVMQGLQDGGGGAGSSYRALEVDLKGLVPMQQPHKTSILYAEPVDAGGTGTKTETGESSRLYAFAKMLKQRFEQEGFVVEEERKLRLHATVVNTVYAKPKAGARRGRGRGRGRGKQTQDVESSTAPPEPEMVETRNPAPDSNTVDSQVGDRSEGHGPNAKSWMRFDATSLIRNYGDFTWADGVRIDRVQVCKMGAEKILDKRGDVVDEKYEVVFERLI
ncbi:hypothetical protein K491DRAFT_690180 [Lophiostoma macrostomum CBS 122681]|uniref:A-kinase anchor protein 7-like phosphoesterase domain-containing protein n=1 Tax=Lophiostoma macrostomum CBS 122681 TaxID=1314788 RepID=A0A6A6TFG5_9PLEO|nr:hypothetical protein K491DRAFT_690180 [Lophiostoma macrostomum CBS 122681]